MAAVHNLDLTGDVTLVPRLFELLDAAGITYDAEAVRDYIRDDPEQDEPVRIQVRRQAGPIYDELDEVVREFGKIAAGRAELQDSGRLPDSRGLYYDGDEAGLDTLVAVIEEHGLDWEDVYDPDDWPPQVAPVPAKPGDVAMNMSISGAEDAELDRRLAAALAAFRARHAGRVDELSR